MCDVFFPTAGLRAGALVQSISLYVHKGGLKPHFIHFIFQDYLHLSRSDLSVSSLPGGVDYYRACLAWHTTLDVNPERFYQLGLQEADMIRKKMSVVRITRKCVLYTIYFHNNRTTLSSSPHTLHTHLDSGTLWTSHRLSSKLEHAHRCKSGGGCSHLREANWSSGRGDTLWARKVYIKWCAPGILYNVYPSAINELGGPVIPGI